MIINKPISQRVYFIDGPARGQSMLSPRVPGRLSWDDGDATAHAYQRVTRFRSTYFYRHVG